MGGSFSASDKNRLLDFLLSLYGDDVTIEAGVITHHDSDHVSGLGRVLEDDRVWVETVFHNGLASYIPGKAGMPKTKSKSAVMKAKGNVVQRVLARVFGDGPGLEDDDLVGSLGQLREGYKKDVFHGVYFHLARAILDPASGVSSFIRAYEGQPFIHEVDDGRADLTDVELDVLWPQEHLREYGGLNWGETINGNSVTFRLDYDEFSMLFTGDHNEHSEEVLLHHLDDTGASDKLNVDVLKIPHHGSGHAYRPFFEAVAPVISVASQGSRGVRGWKHPSTDVIKWLGGPHRVYNTHIHERRFSWEDFDEDRMLEQKHVLIETDGKYFRVVEVHTDAWDLNSPPSVAATRRSHGTRWIKAR